MTAAPRCAKCRRGEKHAISHGTRGAYVNHGCRCAPCQNANREHCKRYRATHRESLIIQGRQRYSDNRESILAEKKAQYASRPEVIEYRARVAQRRAKGPLALRREYIESNRERINEQQRLRIVRNPIRHERAVETTKAWRRRNRQYCAAQNAKRKAGRSGGEGRSRHRTLWTVDEDRIALREDISLAEAAALLSRSPAAVSTRRTKIARRKEQAA